jgi:diguanylate cyclase (GGDEF)-like protein
MRISTITNWAYGVTLVLTGLSGASFILSSRSADLERLAIEEHRVLDELGEQLALGAEKMSDEARLYAMRGNPRHLAEFQREERRERRRERAITEIRVLGASPAELSALVEVERQAEALDTIERAALARYRGGDSTGAQRALFGSDHERVQTAMLEALTRFRQLTTARTTAELDTARSRSDWLGMVAKAMLGLTAALFLAVLYFVLRRRVAMPLAQMTGAVTRLARQDYTVELPDEHRKDEIGDMSQAISVFRANALERDRLDAERQRDQQTKDLILQMMHRLQACQAQDELAEIVTRFAPRIFPELAGQLYVLNDNRTKLVCVGTWLEAAQSFDGFPPGDCWGLRRGRPHASNRGGSDIACPHLGEDGMPGLCVPLTAQGDTIGLLHVEERDRASQAAAAARLYLELIAENIGLAVANLQLRERLTNLAVRDALTGLLNRRCLDEALNRHARESGEAPIACIMLDIDHFKRFNDEFGHDAGDMVMQHVAQIMRDTVASQGSVYRFGGEEFTILLPGLDEAAGHALAETVRERIGTAPLAYRGRILGTISTSAGVSAAPDDGPGATVLLRADTALLQAKSGGRNRTVRASSLMRGKIAAA